MVDRGAERMHASGYGGVGVAEIAELAGVPKGSFYNYFADKAEFGAAVVDRFGAQVVALLKQETADGSRPPLERLRAFFEGRERHFRRSPRGGCLLGNFALELADHESALRGRIAAWMDAFVDEVARCLEEAQERGDMRSRVDAKMLARVVAMGWEGALMAMRVRQDVAPLSEFREVLFSGLLA